MAVYILIRKVKEDSKCVDYAFGINEDSLGIMQIHKDSGKIFIIKDTPENAEFTSQRAGRKIYLHWKDGKFPDETCWAS